MTYRWIVYPQCDGILTFSGLEPVRVESLEAARDVVEQTRMDFNHDEVSAFVYPYSDEDWDTAQEFVGIGNPFDYPTKVIETGPRGGTRVVNA